MSVSRRAYAQAWVRIMCVWLGGCRCSCYELDVF